MRQGLFVWSAALRLAWAGAQRAEAHRIFKNAELLCSPLLFAALLFAAGRAATPL